MISIKENVIYNRVSTEEQFPEQMRKDCENLARELGFKDWEYLEEKESAWSDTANREVFDSISANARKGHVKNLIIWDFDRLYRKRLKTVEFMRNYSKLGLKVYSFRQRWFEELKKIPAPWNEIIYDLLLQLVGWMAEEESNKKSDRVKKAVKKDRKGVTVSYKGNKWGRKELSKATVEDVLKLKHLSMREIASKVTYWDKNGHRKNLSVGSVHKILSENKGEETSQKGSS